MGDEAKKGEQQEEGTGWKRLGEFVTAASEMSSFPPETLGCWLHTDLCTQCAGHPRYGD